jgi:DNA-binding transcriptional MerR regulator
MAQPGGGERRRRTPRREFYSIGEVCAMLDLRPHVLRYWETQFAELAPPKNRAGNRLYRARDVELIALIRRLVHEEKYTIAGARERIAEMREEGAATSSATRALEVAFLRSLRDELEEVLEILEVPE